MMEQSPSGFPVEIKCANTLISDLASIIVGEYVWFLGVFLFFVV
jgi:hypothetical protein